MDPWLSYTLLVVAIVGVLLLLAVVLRIDKLLRRVALIRGYLKEERDSGVAVQLTEAVASLQSVAVSLDRIALRCDDIDEKVSAIVSRGPGGEGGALADALGGMREGLSELGRPLEDIRAALTRTEHERLRDAVNRTLFHLGYEKVTILTDPAELTEGTGKILVEVRREGVKAKGYVVLEQGSVTEHKISSAYEMFP